MMVLWLNFLVCCLVFSINTLLFGMPRDCKYLITSYLQSDENCMKLFDNKSFAPLSLCFPIFINGLLFGATKLKKYYRGAGVNFGCNQGSCGYSLK